MLAIISQLFTSQLSTSSRHEYQQECPAQMKNNERNVEKNVLDKLTSTCLKTS